MSTRRALALGLLIVFTTGIAPTTVAAQEQSGMINGKAREAKKPYTDYTVQLRDIVTGQITQTVALTDDGSFSLAGVKPSARHVVELFSKKVNKVVCTEGPFVLTSEAPNKYNVVINCGATPAAWWLLVAGAGTATTIAVTQVSGGSGF